MGYIYSDYILMVVVWPCGVLARCPGFRVRWRCQQSAVVARQCLCTAWRCATSQVVVCLFYKHTAGIGKPVFRNVLKCFSGNCTAHLLSVLVSVGVRTEGNGLVQICATVLNRPVVWMELLLVLMEELRSTADSIVKRSVLVKRRTLKWNSRVPFCTANRHCILQS